MLLRICKSLILSPFTRVAKLWDSLSPTLVFLLLLGVWLAGVAVIWALLPPGLFARWVAPEGNVVQGFLDEGRTAVSAAKAKQRVDYTTGPLRLWDVRSGRLVASHFSKDEEFHSIEVSPRGDWLMIVQRDPERWLLRLCDAKTGQDVGQFISHLPHAALSWTLSPDQSLTAFATMEAEEQFVEWREAPGGKLVARLAGCKAPMFFSPDGRRFAASLGRTFAAFEAPSGRMILKTPEKEVWEEYPVTPRQFSPDGSLVVDSEGRIWDLATGLPRPGNAGSSRSWSHFARDRFHRITNEPPDWISQLACFDLVSGKEIERLRKEMDWQHRSSYLGWLRPDDDLLVVVSHERDRSHLRRGEWGDLIEWLRQNVVIEEDEDVDEVGVVSRPPPLIAEFQVIDDSTGELLARGKEMPRYYWASSRILVATDPQHENRHSFWNIPAQRAWGRIIVWVGLWSVLMLAVWQLAKRRRGRVDSARRTAEIA